MVVDFRELAERLRAAGPNNVRCVPASGQHVDNGKYEIEVRSGDRWDVVATGLTQTSAFSLVREHCHKSNRVILG